MMEIKVVLSTIALLIPLLSIGSIDTTGLQRRESLEIPCLDPMKAIPGQLTDHVWTIFEDADGDQWIGTNQDGVIKMSGSNVEYFTKKDGVGGSAVRDIIQDQNGQIWLATSIGLTKFYDGVFTNYVTGLGENADDIWTLMLDQDGLIWMGTNDGVIHYDGNQFNKVDLPKAPIQNPFSQVSPKRITTMMKDDSGNIWIGSDGYGITVIDGSSYSFITTDQGLSDNNIQDIYQDSKGVIWIGTMFGGLDRYAEGDFTNYSEGGAIRGINVSGIHEDHQGSVWFTSEGFGIYKFDGTEFTNYFTEQGLESHIMYTIHSDQEGKIMTGGWLGIFELVDDHFVPVTKN